SPHRTGRDRQGRPFYLPPHERRTPGIVGELLPSQALVLQQPLVGRLLSSHLLGRVRRHVRQFREGRGEGRCRSAGRGVEQGPLATALLAVAPLHSRGVAPVVTLDGVERRVGDTRADELPGGPEQAVTDPDVVL